MKRKIRYSSAALWFFLLGIFVAAYFLRQFCLSSRPNVLLITVDALRPDHLGCYGYQRDVSPNIDRLAKDGVIFKEAVANSFWTLCSITSIATSTHLHTHKIFDAGDFLSEKLLTVADVLSKHGYYTAFITDHGLIRRIIGFSERFDDFFTTWTYQSEDGKLKKAFSIFDIVIQRLKRNKKRPFFIWVHAMDTHAPLCPPAPFKDIYLKGSQAKEIVPISTGEWVGVGGLPSQLVRHHMWIQDLNYYKNVYDGAIKYADFYIGILVEELKKMGIDKRTLIIISADHGECFGEHGVYFDHDHILYDELLKIPLIIKFPNDLMKRAKNTIVSKQVQSLDIAPTILDVLHIPKPKTMLGYSLLPLVTGAGDYPSDYVLSGCSNASSIRGNGWKLIFSGEEEKYELYNLKNDPRETRDLLQVDKEEYREEFGVLKENMERMISESELGIEHKGKESLDAEIIEQLRSLGYIQ